MGIFIISFDFAKWQKYHQDILKIMSEFKQNKKKIGIKFNQTEYPYNDDIEYIWKKAEKELDGFIERYFIMSKEYRDNMLDMSSINKEYREKQIVPNGNFYFYYLVYVCDVLDEFEPKLLANIENYSQLREFALLMSFSWKLLEYSEYLISLDRNEKKLFLYSLNDNGKIMCDQNGNIKFGFDEYLKFIEIQYEEAIGIITHNCIKDHIQKLEEQKEKEAYKEYDEEHDNKYTEKNINEKPT